MRENELSGESNRPKRSPPIQAARLTMPGCTWEGAGELPGHKFTCGYCGAITASNRGIRYAETTRMSPTVLAAIYICSFCDRPTYFGTDQQIPGISSVASLRHLPDEVHVMYEEVRQAATVPAPTLCVMGCRKLLMHVAVERGAAQNLRFVEYVDYLKNNGHIAAGSEVWIDKVRQLGNEANHEIHPMDEDAASLAMRFTQMLLCIMYEFPGDLAADSK